MDLYLGRWIRDAQWKFIFTEEVWIIPTRGGFVPREMNKRCAMEIYIYRRSLELYQRRGGFVPREMNKRCRMEIYIYQGSWDYTKRAVDLYLWGLIRDAEWKFIFSEEVWIIPTRGGFVPMKMNKRCRIEIYIYRWSLDYTNARWIFT